VPKPYPKEFREDVVRVARNREPGITLEQIAADFGVHRPAHLAWYALYIGVAALLVWNRFLTPVRRALRHRLTVTEVRPEAPGMVSGFMSGRHLDELGAESGQFFR
jgi:hypothetical protein